MRTSLLAIRPQEGRMVALFFLLSFLLGTSFNFLEASAFALFLVEFSSRALPWIYILNAVVVSAITVGYLRLGGRVSFSSQLALNLGLLMALLAAFRVGLEVGGAVVVFALPVLFQIVVSLGNIAYWTLAGRVFHVRQAKRLFGVIGSGMWVAIVLTGFLMPRIVRSIGTANLLVPSIVGMGAALALLVYITRTYAVQVERRDIGQARHDETPVLGLLRNRFVLFMFSLSILAWMAFFFVDNIFYNRVAARFPDEQDLAAFLGIYLGVLGIVTLFITALVTAPVIGRFGVRGGLLVLPVILLAGAAAFAATGTLVGIVPILFWLATLNKVLDLSLMFSVDQSSQTILYQPLPARERTRVQTVDEGMVRMVAVGAAGGLLLLLNQVLNASVVQLSYVLVVVMVIWVAAAVVTGREYPKALKHALVRRRLTGAVLRVGDPESAAVLRQALHDPNPQVALAALHLLEDAGIDRDHDWAKALITHPSADVRREAVRLLARRDGETATSLLRERANGDPSPVVRAEAVRGLAALGSPADTAAILALLEDDDPIVRQGAIVGLLHQGSPAARNSAVQALVRLAEDRDSGLRTLACETIALAASPDLTGTLTGLLQDPSRLVRQQAALSVAAGPYGDLWPIVVAMAGEQGVQTAAVAALWRGGDSAVPAIAAALDNPRLPETAAVRLLKACGRIGTPAAAQPALPLIGAQDEDVRTAAVCALQRCGYRIPGRDAEHHFVHVRNECEDAARLLAIKLQLVQSDRGPDKDAVWDSLLEGLERQLASARERILLLLSMQYDSASLLQVREGIVSSPEQRAYAVELLEMSLHSDVRPFVLPFFEDLADEARLQRLSDILHPHLFAGSNPLLVLVAGESIVSDRWVQACSLVVASEATGAPADLGTALASGLRMREDDSLLASVADSCISRMKTGDAELVCRQIDHTLWTHTVGEITMLSPIERVLILRSAELFRATPDAILAEIAGLAEEMQLEAGQTIIRKGEHGDSMYLIATGEVRVHDDDHTINYLQASDIFGEMALLDAEPRMASVTATTDTVLLRIDQEPFFELLEDRGEVARGVIHVLTTRLRDCVRGRMPTSQHAG